MENVLFFIALLNIIFYIRTIIQGEHFEQDIINDNEVPKFRLFFFVNYCTILFVKLSIETGHDHALQLVAHT